MNTSTRLSVRMTLGYPVGSGVRDKSPRRIGNTVFVEKVDLTTCEFVQDCLLSLRETYDEKKKIKPRFS
jgi:hypothetical protein